ILVFFRVNYLVHASTIPSMAGTKWYDMTCWTILTLFLPFAGLGKLLGMICRHFIVGESDLEKAEVHNALLLVMRMAEWTP
ncbi:hypothetical protein JAAARDRAFT_105470, partial [Jaapia argillacea MUCL 33604]